MVIVVDCCCKSEEDVSSDPERREDKGDSGDRGDDRSQIQRQGTSEQQQGELKHHRKALDGGIKVPPLESI